MERSLVMRTIAATVAVLMLGAGAALATNTVSIDTVVKIRNHFPAFHGRLIATNDACEQLRTVKLFKERRNGGKKLLGTTTSDLEGKWQVLVDPLASGAYFAVAQRREEGTAGTIFVCERGKSRFAVVD
jgi:hypothetical protein